MLATQAVVVSVTLLFEPMLHVPPFWQGSLVTQMLTGTHPLHAEFGS